VDNRIGQQAIVDRNAFDRWTIATHQHDPTLASTIARHFSPHLNDCFQQWKAQGGNEDITPLDLPAYVATSTEEAAVEQKAAEANVKAEYANRVHDQYILIEIGTATALFFLGLSSLGKRGRLRVAYVAVGTVIFLAVAIVTLSWPKIF